MITTASFSNILRLLLCSSLFVMASLLTLEAQHYKWAKAIGGNESDVGNSLAVDADGNVYATGTFKATVDFDPSIGIYNLTSSGDNDMFITKFDINGNFVWAKVIGGISSDEGLCIKVDTNGNVYATGTYKETLLINTNQGIVNLTSNGINDILICKLDKNGNFIWVKSIGGSSADIANGIDIDPNGNVYATGNFGSVVDFDPGVGISNYTSKGNADIFTLKLDLNGNYVWAKVIGNLAQISYGIAVDTSGNVYTTGFFSAELDFDPSASTSNLSSKGFEDIFITKLDKYGNFVWAKSMTGTDVALGVAIAVDKIGNVYTTGYFRGTVDFDPGVGEFDAISGNSTNSIFISKLNKDGDFIWVKTMINFYNNVGYSIAVDNFGNVYSTGYFENTLDFDPSIGIDNLISNGSADIYISKLDQNGNYVWAKSMGGIGYDVAKCIALDASSHIHTIGSFYNLVDFDPDTSNSSQTSLGENDAFISVFENLQNQSNNTQVKIYPNPTSSTFTLSMDMIKQGIVTLKLIDMNGKIVQDIEAKVLNGIFKISIDVSFVNKGNYMFEIRNNNDLIVVKKISLL